MQQLSVAIPTMNRWRFLKHTIPTYLASPHIAEITVTDENGSDVTEISGKFVVDVSPATTKFNLHINSTRMGPYMNKYEAIRKSSSEWIALLDSDNTFTDVDYFGPAAACNLTNPWIIYAPAAVRFVKESTGETEQPFLEYDGLVVNKENWSTVASTAAGRRLLNDGNYVLNRKIALTALPTLDMSVTSGADTFIANYYLVAAGAQICFTSALGYTHVVHAESITELESASTTIVLDDPRWLTLPVRDGRSLNA